MVPPRRDPRSHRELKRWIESKIGAEFFAEVYTDIENEPKIGMSSFIHNKKLIQSMLKKWAKQMFVLGDAEDWNAAASTISRPRETRVGNFWIDSSDFKLNHMKMKVVRIQLV